MLLEQLQQIIEMLKQQIQQIVVLLQQRYQNCAKEGETFTSSSRQCCAGLVKKNIGTPCPDSPDSCAQVISYTCVKPIKLTCAQACKAKGYTDSTCAAWGITQYSTAGGCASGQTSVGWTSDCTAAQLAGGGRACCCYNQTTTCAKEGENIYTSSLANGRPTQCCSGLTAISSCTADGICPNDGSSICAYCGNGVCGLGENKVNCPKDCGGNEYICSRTLSGSPTEAEKAECAQAGGTIYCGNGWCSCSCAQKTCAAICRGMGYTNSQCSSYAISPEGFANKCAAGYVNSNQSASDCKVSVGLVGAGKACCCANLLSTCAKEGEIFTDANRQCCAGLTLNPGSCSSAGCTPSVCHKCGDGICSKGENSTGCSKDCGCGNGKCEGGENQMNCSVDCGNATCALEYWPCWTSSLPNPFETDFSPKQCCAGLTCQMVVPKIADAVGAISGTCMLKGAEDTCANEGETFQDSSRQCCAGLVREVQETPPCLSSETCTIVTRYTCVKPTTTCGKEGEYVRADWMDRAVSTSGAPSELVRKECCAGLTAYGNGCNESVKNGTCVRNPYTVMCGSHLCVNCGDGKCNSAAGENKCNCPADCDNIASCLKEGETGGGGPLSITVKTLGCCAGLKKIIMPNVEDAGFLCTAKCGNGVCDSALEKTYCPQDCAGICSRTLSGSPTSAEKTQCSNAGGVIRCGNGWCACSCGAISCGSTLSADECKLAGGNYTCPEGYSTVSSDDTSLAGSGMAYFSRKCYCSCPSGGSAAGQTTSSSMVPSSDTW